MRWCCPGRQTLGGFKPNSSCGQRKPWLAKHALGGQRAVELENASLQQLIAGEFGETGCNLYAIAAKISTTHCWISVRQEAAAIARAHQHSRSAEHAGASGQVLCRDMLSEVCEQQPAAPERTVRARPTKGVHKPEA